MVQPIGCPDGRRDHLAYLLVDRHHADVTIYWEPVEGAYQHVSTAKFGSALRMPPPFDFDLETSEFR
ncbi:hypothetical protein V7968_21300 [Nocardia vulneris]|uniref:hypothetical protein n=1 Tax=Nocardia vulneris TaxID=1141657 RepID=UPI0030CCDD9E